MTKVFVVLIPALFPMGPIKGAIALANQMVNSGRVILVTLKPGPGAAATINDGVEVIHLWEIGSNFLGKVLAYRRLLQQFRNVGSLTSISMCFSADLVNCLCRDLSLICSSVRGNLLVNYQMDYGFKGRLLAYLHFLLLRRFNLVTVMTPEMASQISIFLKTAPVVIGNFIDEQALIKYQKIKKEKQSLKFVFVGSLTARKRPELLVKAIQQLRLFGHKVHLDILGDGPLKSDIQILINNLGLRECIKIHGQVETPYPFIRAANALVLPSMSEGQSRAAMEALFLGTPCVLRNVDGNHEMVRDRKSGILFGSDIDLPQAMIDVLSINFEDGVPNLLRKSCGQKEQVDKLLGILEEIKR